MMIVPLTRVMPPQPGDLEACRVGGNPQTAWKQAEGVIVPAVVGYESWHDDPGRCPDHQGA